MAALTLAAGVLLGALLVALPGRVLVRQLQAELAGRDTLRLARDGRILQLEHQLDQVQARVLKIQAPPQPGPVVELPAEAPLPSDVERAIRGFEDPDAQDEYRELARELFRSRPDATGEQVVAMIFNE